jgi:hypothetical protein
MLTLTDPHLSLVRPVSPQTPDGCQECLILGSAWVHLRLCLTCGHVGCCDSSPLRHARAHAFADGHSIVQSFEPGLLAGGGSYYAAVALDAGEVLAVPVDRLRDLVARCGGWRPGLRAYLLRRSILIGLGAGLRIVGYSRAPGGSGTSPPGTGSRAGGWTLRPTCPLTPCWPSSA